jgi:hypothetical protein
MCFPAIAPALPAILGGLGVAQTGLQYMGARRQAKQQARFQAQAQAAEAQRKQQEATSIRMRQLQEQQALGEELNKINLRTQKGIQRDIVERGERGGIAGMATEAAIGDWFRQQGAVSKGLYQQQGFGETSTALALEQVELASQQRMIGLSQPIDRPSPLGAVLGGIQSGLSGARTGLTLQSMMGGGSNPPIPKGSVRTTDARGLPQYTI